MSNALTILQLNDLHAYLEPHSELFWNGDHAEYRTTGGVSRIAAIFKAARQEQPGAVLAFDGGDTIHGTYPAVQTDGQALIPILNALGFDAMTGHWDFGYGPARLRHLTGQLNYPFLAANCYDIETGERPFPPYTVVERGGVRVGVIGLAATIVDKTMSPHFSRGLRFTLGKDELPDLIARLRHQEGADLIILVSHLGFPQEMKLATEVDGIDILLSSHTHNRLTRPAVAGRTIVIQSGCHGSFVGRLDLEIEGGRVSNFSHRLITVGPDIAPDPAVQDLVDQALAPHRHELSQIVGHTATGLNRNTVLEATMDNLLLQSLLALTGAEVAFSNGWRYGAPAPPGPITLNDLWNIIPVNPPVSTTELTGDEIWTMLEEALEHTFGRDPYDQMGGYLKRVMGLNMYLKIENPRGQRIQELFIRGERLQPDRVYHAAFVTNQGVPKQYGSRRTATDIKAIEALLRYLKHHNPVQAELRGSVVAV